MNGPRAWLGYFSCVPPTVRIFSAVLLGLVWYESVSPQISPIPDPGANAALREVKPESPAGEAIEAAGFRSQAAPPGTSDSLPISSISWRPAVNTLIRQAGDQVDFGRYRLFRHSDGRLHVVRLVAGKVTETWVLDPLAGHPLHRVQGDTAGVEEMDEVASEFEQRIWLPEEMGQRRSEFALAEPESFHVRAFNALTDWGSQGDDPEVPVETSCPSPSRDRYAGSWGRVDGCRRPQMRTFQDGSSQYQYFNVCVGIWDPQVHWITCGSR